MKNAILVFSGVALGFLGVTAAPHSAPRAEAQAAGAAAPDGSVVMGIGGVTQNQNDVCWILFREKSAKPDADFRYSLCLYRAMPKGNKEGYFDLMDMREVTYDMKPNQANHAEHSRTLSPQAMKEMWEDAKKAEAKKNKEGEPKRSDR